MWFQGIEIQWNHTDCEEAQVPCLWTGHLFSQLSETPSLSSVVGSTLLFPHSCCLEVNDDPSRQISAEFCSMLHWSIKCGVHWLHCCGFLSRYIAAYPSRCRVPCLRERWRGFSGLRIFVPKSCIPEPVCSEQGSVLFAPWNISQAVEHSHQYIISLLFWHPEPSPYMSSTIFKLCISIYFSFFLWQCTKERPLLPVLFPLYLIILNSESEVINMANMFLIWPDG